MGMFDRLKRAPSEQTMEVVYVSSSGKNTVQVVGESNYQDALNAVCGGKNSGGHRHSCHAVLVREPRNQYDSNAIGIQIDARLVGYLGRDDAARYAPVMDGARCMAFAVDAIVNGGWSRGNGEEGSYGVTLDIPPPTELANDLRS